MNQLSIVVGILCAQSLGVSPLGQIPTTLLSTSNSLALWRYVPLISSGFAILQVILSPFTLDAPSDLQGEARDKVKRKLWGSESIPARADEAEEESEALLGGSDDNHTSSITKDSKPMTISDLFFTLIRSRPLSSTIQLTQREIKDIRRGTLLIIFTQMAQQLSGVNAVLYFSTGILSDVFKGGPSDRGSLAVFESNNGDAIAKQIGLGITFVNVIMTFPPIPLIRESLVGRKRLLLLSSFSMSCSALLLSFALLTSKSVLAAISIVFFVAGFSIGLGPIPFLILPELVPKRVS
jgi:SP family facilitated glucose transporter-like MFS transporter 3